MFTRARGGSDACAKARCANLHLCAKVAVAAQLSLSISKHYQWISQRLITITSGSSTVATATVLHTGHGSSARDLPCTCMFLSMHSVWNTCPHVSASTGVPSFKSCWQQAHMLTSAAASIALSGAQQAITRWSDEMRYNSKQRKTLCMNM